MISARRSGFSLVELSIVMVVGMILLSAAYQSLIVQQRGYRTTGATIADQDVLRMALGVLEAELREIASIDDGTIGGTDILAATANSITVRAPRKLAFICSVSPSEKSMIVWSEWDVFAPEDDLLIFVDGTNDASYKDDRWEVAKVKTVNSSTSSCPNKTPAAGTWKVILYAHPLTDVWPGAPVRAFEELTYGLYEFDQGWGLGRKSSSTEPPDLLVGGLAREDGLVFEYFDAAGNPMAGPSNVSSIGLTLKTAQRQAGGTEPKSLTSTISLRNN